MVSLAEIDRVLAPHHLSVFGGFHPDAEDRTPEGCETLLMLGPREPGFWAHVTAEAEFHDGQPDPLDRWSRRVIGRLACDLGGKALFPFGGPPHHPFIAWALATGRAWSSPVGLLVHDQAGLMVSYRGALALRGRLALGAPPKQSPCTDCHRPCESACPVGALGARGYDVASCHDHLATDAGRDCMEMGCRARRICPISQGAGRAAAQSAFHMRNFHP
jgi:hypothetical protein